MDGVEWLVLEDPSSGLAMYRTGQLDCAPWHQWTVRQADLDALKKSHPHLIYKDFLASNVSHLWMRVDQSPFNDVRVRRAISHAIDRQGLIDAVTLRGAPTPVIPPGLAERSLPIDQLGAGATYYQYNPQEARRLLAEAGLPQGFKTLLHTSTGYGSDLIDAVQLVQRSLKNVGIAAELKLQEYGAYFATTAQGKFEGMAMGPVAPAWEPDFMLSQYIPGSPRNNGHVNDPTLTAMVQEQRRTQDLEARKKIIFDMQRYVAEQQYRVYLGSDMLTGSWQPYVKNYTPNHTFDFGGRAAALWLQTGEHGTKGGRGGRNEHWRRRRLGWDSRGHTFERRRGLRRGKCHVAGEGRQAAGRGRRGDGGDEAVTMATEGLDDVLPHAVIGYGLANHSQAPGQRRLADGLAGPAGREQFVFGDSAVALRQEMDEHGERLGLEGPHHAAPPQLPAVDVEFALAKHKDHGTASR